MVGFPQIPRLVSLALLATLIVALGLTFYRVVAPFLMSLFLAAVATLLCQPLYRRLQALLPGKPRLAAGLATGLIVLTILVPLYLGTASAAHQLLDTDWSAIVDRLRNSDATQWLVGKYESWTGKKIDLDQSKEVVTTWARKASADLAKQTLGSAGRTLSLLGGAVQALVQSLMFVIALYYFLADGPRLVAATENLLPLHRDYQRQLLMQFDQSVRAVVSATFAAAMAQGLATAVGMYVAARYVDGERHFFLVLVLSTLTALVPLLGTWLIWGPYALALILVDDQWLAGSLLAVYGTVFIGVLDNVVRTWVLHSNVKLHPLLAFVSVLGGIQVMGLWGVFIGPIVASCLYALVQIFNNELTAFSRLRQAGATRIVPQDDSKPTAASQPDAVAPPLAGPSRGPEMDVGKPVATTVPAIVAETGKSGS